MNLSIALVLPLALAGSPRDSPVGLWRTIDDISHKARGLVRIFERDGAYFGRIEASFDPVEARERCGKCRGELRNQPVIGLMVLKDVRRHGAEYTGGEILDPETGSIYRCRLTLDENGAKLVVRGYIGLPMIGRSQTWIREE